MIFKNIIIMQIRKAISKRMDIELDKLVYASLDIDFINGQSFLKDENNNIITQSNVDILGEYTDLLIGRLEKNIKFDKLDYISICMDFLNKTETTTMYYVLNNQKMKSTTTFF